MLVEYRHGGRRTRAERRRALAAIWIRIRWTGNEHVALRDVPVLRKIQQRLDIVVVQSVSSANHVLIRAKYVPRQAESRSEVLGLSASRRIADEWNRDRTGCRRIDERIRINVFVIGPDLAVPSQTQVERQVPAHSPVILHVPGILGNGH